MVTAILANRSAGLLHANREPVGVRAVHASAGKALTETEVKLNQLLDANGHALAVDEVRSDAVQQWY